MDVAEYLQSEQAVQAAQILLLESKSGARRAAVDAPLPFGEMAIQPAAMWQRAWHCVYLCARYARYAVAHEMAVVYFRPEGDRYIVTDLGVAVRALRLRTGRVGGESLPPTPGVRMGSGGLLIATSDDDEDTVSAADLPRAICRVLLVAHRVTLLEVP